MIKLDDWSLVMAMMMMAMTILMVVVAMTSMVAIATIHENIRRVLTSDSDDDGDRCNN